VELGQVAEFIRGITFKPDDKVDVFSDGSVVCFRTSNVQEVLDQSDLIAVPEFFVKREEQFVSEGDILVSTANSWNLVGKCSWVPEINYRAAIGGFISILRAKHRLIDPKYLYYWFNSSDIQTLVRSFGRQTTNISNMDVARVLKLQIPFPPLAEQQRIAAILDCADALRVKRRAALAKLDELLQSTFIEMFGDPVTNPKNWNLHKIGALCNVTKLAGFEYTKHIHYQDSGDIIAIRALNVKNGGLVLDKVKYIDRETSNLLKRSKLFKNDMVITYIGVNIGDVAVINEDDKFHLAPNVAKVTPKNTDLLDTKYLMHCFGFIHSQMSSMTTNTAKQALNMAKIRDLLVPLPNMILQKQFSSAEEVIDSQKKKVLEGIRLLDHLFYSLQQRAFRGEL
jgi:type I restriction enzyme S subunit